MPASTPRAQPVPIWNDTAPARPTAVPQEARPQAKPVYEVGGWRFALLITPFTWLLRLYYRTLRFKMDAEAERALTDLSRPVLSITWHNRSLVGAGVGMRLRNVTRMSCLVSPSKAAAWEAAIFRRLGMNNVRGSSTRRSIQATREIIKAYRAGQEMWLTPDGPSGPRYDFKTGAVGIGRITRAPILVWGATSDSAWRPHTWDRHFIALPFTTVRLHARILEHADVYNGRDDAGVAEFLKRQLLELNADPF